MPYINVKLVKEQTSLEQQKKIIEGLTDLVVTVMGREKSLTVITLDELSANQWSIGGETLEQSADKKAVSFVNIKVSKGTTDAEEISKMMKATKELLAEVLGNNEEANYFILDELNPDAWGFDGISMTERRKLIEN
ncbi:tautomerase family protein [Clostridium cellulovorans]|uniref:4-oxalocrotonate tautomerase family enzyme n=1 Tax=Clostridium cellulovorans (strain ATCC 35296 / DSM 3052 / OCM 3 / 743B) TaxID=573061 RepID=D9SLP7_CLOC7|nr:tautomerase family protein [Clostridium cellulovorans]ADL53684.1 4-oxalocrotonate tautomerase family enzyme [Clostridium cellulovorans 743B]